MLKTLYLNLVRLLVGRNSNDSQSSYKIYFNQTDRITAKTPLRTGTLTLGGSDFEIIGDANLRIKFADITSLKLEFPHSSALLAHLIEVKYKPNETIYFGVLRAALFKVFVINNLVKTTELFEGIKKNLPQDIAWSVLDKRGPSWLWRK